MLNRTMTAAALSGALAIGGCATQDYVDKHVASVQSQLGLKLTAKKGLAEVLVVDHIEKSPTGN